ncbi:MAG: AMP-binding protein [Haloferacaceae archaeon]
MTRDPLAARVRVSPDGTALVDAATGEEWTFEALDAAVDRTAGRLAALGVTAGDRLGVALGPRPAYVRLVHAALRVGATLAPLSHRLTEPELRDRFGRVEPTAVVCDAGTESRVVAATEAPVASVDDPDAGATALADAGAGAASPTPHEWRPGATALLPFTSGTTGDPKPVRLTATNLLASAGASALRLGLDPDDRWLVTLSLDHVGGLSPVLRMPLYGTTVVLRRSFEAGPAADDLTAHDVTCVSLVPTMLRRMLDARGTLAESLRVVLLGGAPAPEALVERCWDYSVPVYPTYGMTETASQIATATPAEAFADPGTVGRPLFGTDLTVVDEAGEELPPGEPGELVVAGPTVSPGYYGMPEATADAFAADGLRTGDVGVVDERGSVRVLNRVDDRILTGGENVDPGEVVAALREHPAVADAAVVGLPDPEWGERVAALVVAEDRRDDVDRDALEAHCRERLAGFKLPRTVGFADDLPRTVSGTVDREAVRERLETVREEREGAGDDGFRFGVAGDGAEDSGTDGDGADAGGSASGGIDAVGSDGGGPEDDGIDAGGSDADGSESDGTDAGESNDDRL